MSDNRGNFGDVVKVRLLTWVAIGEDRYGMVCVGIGYTKKGALKKMDELINEDGPIGIRNPKFSMDRYHVRLGLFEINWGLGGASWWRPRLIRVYGWDSVSDELRKKDTKSVTVGIYLPGFRFYWR